MSISTICLSCALLNRLKTCKGKKLSKNNSCAMFIDNRAGCRRCAYVSSCKSLGKKIGIYHVCGNFEKASKDTKLLPAKDFPDYELYLERRSSSKQEESIGTSDTGSKKSSKLNSSRRKIPLIKAGSKQSAEELHKEKLAAMDNALLESFDSKDTMLNAIMSNADDRADDWSPESVIDKIVSSNYDPRVFSLINDGDLIKPDNPVRFMIEPHFMNISLFPRQLQIALNYFAAYCPYCSDHKFIKDGVQVDTPVEEILDRTEFYSNGVCPKCGKTRYEAIQQGLHGNYSTFIGLCGQRCVTGDTYILTSDGLVEMQDIAKKHAYVAGFQDYNVVDCPAISLEDGTLAMPSHFYTSERPDTVYKVFLGNGMELDCTADHPIMTSRGFVATRDLVINEDTVPIYINQQVWGSSSPLDLPKINRYILDKYFDGRDSDRDFPAASNVTEIDEDIATFLGILAANEYQTSIDVKSHVAHFCSHQTYRLFGDGGSYSLIGQPYVKEYFDLLLEGNVFRVNANGVKDYDDPDLITTEKHRIPKHIMQSPKNIVCAFLKGLLEATFCGTGSGYCRFYSCDIRGITFRFASPTMAKQVSALLHNLGIVGVKRGFHSPVCLMVTDKKSLARLRDEIGTISYKGVIDGAILNSKFEQAEDGDGFYYCKVRNIVKRSKPQVTYDFTVPTYHRFVSNTVVSSNSGKSVSSSIFAAAILAQYISLPNPITFMKQLESVTFRMSFVGLRYQDAFDNLWQDFYNHLINAPWYRMYRQFLDEEGIRLGRELYKVRDSFAIFSAKGLAVAPSGPDKRYLRGKCIQKETYINTSLGFIRIGDLEKRKNLGKIYIGGKSHDIVAVEKQTKKKKCLKIMLKNGQYVEATTDHRIPVYSAKTNSLELKEAQELRVGDFLVTQLGGDFPEEYMFDFTFKYRPSYIRAAEWISDGHIFTMFDLADELGISVSGARGHALDEMLKAGVINKYRQRDEHGWELPCLYQINEKFRLEEWNKLRDGSINEKKSLYVLPTHMTLELARVIGYLLSDGWVNGKYTISHVSTSPEKHRDFVRCFTQVFGFSPNTRLDKRLMYGPSRDLPGYCSEFSLKPILKFFEHIGLRHQKAATKTIPDCIMQSPRDCVLECVSAMFSSDGGISRTSYKGRFYYASDSKEMILQLQQLMLKLGYYCSIRRKGEHLVLNTLESINFYEEYTGLNKRIWRDDFALGRNARYAFKEYKVPGTRRIHTKSYINEELGVRPKSRFNKWIDKDIVFTPIKSIQKVGLKTVYDLEIDSKKHLFPANNILVHNTRIYSSLDEICHFFGKEGSVKLDPDEVSLALDNSLYTVRSASNKLLPKYPDVPTAHSINISSPRSKLDKGMRLHKQAKHIPSFFSIRLPTWEFNPNITREDLNDKFLTDPIGAERDFGANPPFGDNLYLPNAADILGIITKKRNSLEVIKYKTVADSLGTKTLYPIIKVRPNNAPCILACDAGFSKNSFGLALLYRKQIEIESIDEDEQELPSAAANNADEAEEEEYQEITVCCGLLEIQPKDGMPLNFPMIYQFVIKKILENFNVQLVAFDRWQSISLRQSVYQDFGIDAVQYSVNMQDFNNLKEDILSENFIVPKLEQDIQDIISLEKDLDVLVHNKPVSHLLVQMLTSKDNGRIITKGDETSDDILRAVCLGHSLLWNENYDELFSGYEEEDDDEEDGPRTDPTMLVGVGVGNSGGVFGGNSSGGGGNGATGGMTVIPGIGVGASLG